ncbi:MAG: DUF5110 domain-containing protein [Bacteroidia bacterium]|nr:DUF5110 domain-containing protein [Bacteroidia bacterium]
MKYFESKYVHILFFFILNITGIYSPASAQDDPVANPAAIVIRGNARFTILTPQLVRLEWSKDGKFEDKASLVFINRRLPVPHFTVDDKNGWTTIITDSLNIRYKPGKNGFTGENLAISFQMNGKTIEWHPGLKDSLNLKGTTRTLDGTNGAKDVTLEDGLLSRSGWALVDDSQSQLFDGSDWNWVTPRKTTEHQDWYFFGYKHNYKQALYDFTQVAGKIPMPPKFAFGYWWSRYWTYSDKELRDLVNDTKKNNIPLDVLIIDMDWHNTYGLSSINTRHDPFGQAVGWTGYTWNRKLFPEPQKFLAWTNMQHLRTALNLHPASGISPMEEKYPEFAKKINFDTTGHKYIPFRIEDKKWTSAWFNVVLHPLQNQRVDFWWLDWQAWLENTSVKGLSNTWWLNYVFFTDMERSGNTRPLLFHRWGGLGNHRYQIGFSGDTYITWESLAYQPYFTSTASNVCYGYWSHDIGGHMGGEPSQEMYLRWLQWGIFSPVVRTHSTKNADLDRRIWKQGDYSDAMREALHLRYSFVPYIYAAARQAYEKGLSICRPMYYDYPETKEAYSFKGQFMFGDEMLVAPVTEKVNENTGLAVKKIWLPRGDWYEWFSGTLLNGNQIISRNFSFNEIPVYVKVGSIIPMLPPVNNLQSPVDTLVLAFIPGGNGENYVYDDDASTSAYKNDEFTRTRVKYTVTNARSVKIEIFPLTGHYRDMKQERAYELHLPCMLPPVSVQTSATTKSGAAGMNSTVYNYGFAEVTRPGSWSYDASGLCIIILTPRFAIDEKIDFIIKWKEDFNEMINLTNGIPGFFSRLPQIVKLMKEEVNRRDGIANAPDLLLKAASLSTQIQYHVENTASLLKDFSGWQMNLLNTIINYPYGDKEILERAYLQFPFNIPLCKAPEIILDKTMSDQPVTVSIKSTGNPRETIHYTLDGTIPEESSQLYTSPFIIVNSATITARTFREGYTGSIPAKTDFTRNLAKSVTYRFPCSPKYTGGGDFTLVDGRTGSADNFHNYWVGFQENDMIATIELLKPTDLHSITASFLKNQGSWIFLPASVEYEVSSDGEHFTEVYKKEITADQPSDETEVLSFPAKFKSNNITHIRVTAKNIRQCPAWHPGAGGKCWIFCDEVSFN